MEALEEIEKLRTTLRRGRRALIASSGKLIMTLAAEKYSPTNQGDVRNSLCK